MWEAIERFWSRPPPHVRRTIRRREWAFAMLAVVPNVLVSGAIGLGRPIPETPALGLLLLALVGLAAWVFVHLRLMGRLRREFRAASGRVCLHCGYNLSGLATRGECPECGKDFDIERDAKAWARAGFVVPKGAKPPSLG